jgi:hypothetical protein
MDALKRKKRFWDPKRRAGHSFTREHVWTFQMYQHFVDMGSYELNLMYTFDLARHLDGQPLQFMLKDRCARDLAHSRCLIWLCHVLPCQYHF